MIVKLTLLDRQDVLHYTNVVDVSLGGNRYEVVGTCKIFKNESGNHFGELQRIPPAKYIF